MKSLKNLLSQGFMSRKTFWEVIFFPFLATRLSWVLVAYFVSGNYLPNPTYAKYWEKGFFLTRIFFIDIFSRWDSAAYLSIIKNGYSPSSDITSVFSNIPFFPLFPYLVKSIGWLGLHLSDGFYLALGVVLSNGFFIISAVLLYRLIVVELNYSEQIARRTLGLLFVFPTAFIFASFYTESLFLLLMLLSFTFALEEKWLAAAICTGLILVTRIQGMVVWAVIVYIYLVNKKWNLSRIDKKMLYFAAAPLGLALHLLHLYTLTGYILAPFAAQAAWGRSESGILASIAVNLNSSTLDVFKIDFLLVIIFICASIYILIKWPTKPYGILSLTLCLIPVLSGSLISISRFLLVIFPVFILFGEKLKRMETYEFVRMICYSLQIIYFAGWVNYYWIA